MRRHIILVLLTFSSYCIQAQTFNVKGVVKDITGETLLGVNVIVKNSSRGDVTDFDGNYKIQSVPKGSILVFSYLGFKTLEVVVDKEVINVVLEESSEALDEIVVVGYGTQRKKEITGAVSVVGAETIEALKPTRVENALQGQVAGVNITSSSGSPGAAPNIRIRGISTNGDSRPLILLDGNIIEDLSIVNPGDIESINVLKDATAGIYGVRGANGVILITTKTGRKETDFKFNITSYTGFQQTTRKIPLLNSTEYALLANEAYAANGEALPFPNINAIGAGTDWQNAVFDDAPIKSIDFNVTKGTEKSTYSFGASLLDQDGIVGADKSNFNRRTLKFNFSTEIIEGLTLKTNSLYTNINRKGLAENALGSVLFNALNMPATSGLTDLAPTTGVGIEVVNPIAQTESTFNRFSENKYSGSYSLKYEFLEHFSAELRFQHNYNVFTGKIFRPEADFGTGKVFNVTLSDVTQYKTTVQEHLYDALLRYERTFNDKHNVSLLFGASGNKIFGTNNSSLTSFGIIGTDLNSANIQSSAIDNLAISNQPRDFDGDRLSSYFVRAQYNYKGKYLLSAVVRRDGSSKFGPKNKFGYFPTASIGWLASEEDFLIDSETINLLKVRASYGVIGNDRIASFGFLSSLTGEGTYVFNDLLTFGIAGGALSNPEIRWEKQKPLDIGLDIGLFNKFDITMDYFNKETEDLLLTPQVSGILGVSAPGSGAPIVNAGTVRNRGLEFSISYKEEINENFNFNVNYNFTTIDNEVLYVGSEEGFVQGGSFGVGQDPPSRMEVGLPIGYFYGLQTNGLFQTQADVDGHATQVNSAPGDLRFVDQNNDGVIDSDDRTYIGDPIADITMGLNLSMNYKRFDFSMYAFASIGNEIVRNYERNQPLTNRSVYYLDRWTGPGTSNSFPRVTTGATSNNLFSDFYVEDGSFVRLQNVQFGYSFGEKTLKRAQFDSFRMYISAQNLFTLTKYRGFDPTASGGAPIGAGIDQGFYPTPKTFLIGINVKF